MNNPENNIPKMFEDQASYVEHKHEQWKTAPAIIGACVKEATGAGLAESRRIINGETNEVYEVRTESDEEVIVRIFHGERKRFGKERWALEQCAALGVPVPDMLLVKSIDDESGPLQICVESKIPGVSLQEVRKSREDKSDPELADMLRELGRLLKKVHSVPTNGFGMLDAEGNGKFASVAELVARDDHVNREKILEMLADRPVEIGMIKASYEILDREAAAYGDVSSHLIHNDLSPEHVLIDDGRISGLIDFESACGADPIQEFSLWSLKFDKQYPLRHILEGYGGGDAADASFERKLHFWRIYRGLGSLGYCLREGKRAGADRALKMVRESQEYFAGL